LYFLPSDLVFEASVQKARNGPSTHLIDATSFVKIANNSKKAEASSNFSSYQMLKTDNDFVVIIRTKEARKKVVLCAAP
jgi:hypothetical protein